MIYNPENIRLREVDSRSGRRSKVSYYFRSLDEGDLAFPTVDRTIARHAALVIPPHPQGVGHPRQKIVRKPKDPALLEL